MTVKLTPREQQVLALVARGLSNKEIAAQLEVSIQTVKNILSGGPNYATEYGIYPKLQVHNRVQAALWWLEHASEYKDEQ